ncbi:hypothetical protein C8D88_108211 [Lentzea atacamensis]|uniref:Uncharacterized protein n=2 Tax=Lentzea atacamensis TaxID=531938 RepID=A0A316HVG1_9PSEU|nr:hypothetical protein C8D88_108211 [Lentzea atacamensis]
MGDHLSGQFVSRLLGARRGDYKPEVYLDYLTRPEHGSRRECTMGAEEQTTVVDVDLVELDEGVDQDERERRRNKAYTVVVRTPAGFEARFRVHPNERVETLARQAERFFIRRGELAEGNYRLEKLADGTTVPLVPSATLRESGVVKGTVCVLVVADPQVDG